ncbi:MAG: DMT family transporter [Christensenellales bacterium]|jgi:drug/metabolite transporter (DMT)-like permease
MTRKRQIPGALLILLAGASWSFSGVLSKWVPWSSLSIIGLRSLLAAIGFGLIRGSFRLPKGRGNLLGALGVSLNSTAFIMANKLTTAANAVVLHYFMPIVVIFGSWLIYKQRPGKLDIAASLLATLGIALCFFGGFAAGGLLGDSLALISAFFFAFIFFAARLPGTDPVDYSYLGCLMNCLWLAFIPFDREFVIAPEPVLGILLMSAAYFGGYLMFSLGMRKKVNPVTASIITNIEPVLNPIWVFLFLGEQPGLLSILGAVLVIASVSAYSVIKHKQAA